MALDNYDRVQALNDVVAAWTEYNSLPFITHRKLTPGQSFTFQASDDFQSVVYSISRRVILNGERLLSYTPNGWNAVSILNSANLGVTSSGNTYTYTNNDAARDVDIYIIALQGIIEEV